jgi:hypothetical protein
MGVPEGKRPIDLPGSKPSNGKVGLCHSRPLSGDPDIARIRTDFQGICPVLHLMTTGGQQSPSSQDAWLWPGTVPGAWCGELAAWGGGEGGGSERVCFTG